jgi:hypothetical protein
MKTCRYSLRNQKKIADRLGKDYLELLLKSLDAYFKDRTEEVPEYGKTDKEGNDTGMIYIMIPSVAKNSEMEFQFVLLSKTYNVYNLAYYSAVG